MPIHDLAIKLYILDRALIEDIFESFLAHKHSRGTGLDLFIVSCLQDDKAFSAHDTKISGNKRIIIVILKNHPQASLAEVRYHAGVP